MSANHVDVCSWQKFVSVDRPKPYIHQLMSRSTHLQVPFLNLLALLRERAGEVRIRVGGNSQESAVLVDSLPGGVMISKQQLPTGDVVRTACAIFPLI